MNGTYCNYWRLEVNPETDRLRLAVTQRSFAKRSSRINDWGTPVETMRS